MRKPRLRALACLAALLPALAAASAAPAGTNAAAAQELPQVTVIGNTPLPGLGLPLELVPANVQTADSADMQRQQTLGLADYLNNNFSGINASESAANPYQLDILYHGFTASPLLGTPEGLSVYVDGVRVNESFGDTVNWDLLPQSVIATATLISGSNPVFGLNTLGGALSVRTKSGHEYPGTRIEADGGSFGRRSFEGETGGESGAFDYFVSGNYFEESGWRDNSPSRVLQGFGKAGWQDEKTDLDLSYTYADTSLYGNGAVPESMLGFRREAIYTPDVTENLLNFVNLTGTEFLAPKLLLSGNAWYRSLTTSTANGNINDSYLDPGYGGPALDCSAPAASAAALAWCLPGQNALSRLTQRTRGAALQLTDSEPLRGRDNQGILGADYSSASDTYAQSARLGTLAPNRTLIYVPSPYNDQTVIALGGDNRILGLYATDTLSPDPRLHLTASLRYNRSTETLSGYSLDTAVSDYGAGFGQASPLTGDHTFSRVNPALGATVTPAGTLTLYADYNETSRAPTVLELGCANPAVPCGLPNDFASDPGLNQVVARTVEAGARGNFAAPGLTWSLDAFRTTSSNDIQFVATATNSGYFANVGDTRRQGFDLALGGKRGGLTWRVLYSFVDATYESPFTVNAAANSTADAAGNIVVRAGDRLPLVPRNTGRVIIDYEPTRRWDLGANLVAVSGSWLHGNENNANRFGGTNGAGATITGSGWIGGYAVVNLQATFHATPRLDCFARVVNVLDRQYATAGFLNTSAFTADGAFIADPANWSHGNAVSPAEPRAAWAGVRVLLD